MGEAWWLMELQKVFVVSLLNTCWGCLLICSSWKVIVPLNEAVRQCRISEIGAYSCHCASPFLLVSKALLPEVERTFLREMHCSERAQ